LASQGFGVHLLDFLIVGLTANSAIIQESMEIKTSTPSLEVKSTIPDKFGLIKNLRC
jgi:hypothetical protein